MHPSSWLARLLRSSLPAEFFHNAVVVEGDDAGFFINIDDLDVILALAFAKHIRLVAGFAAAGCFEQNLPLPKDGHDAVGRDFHHRFGGCCIRVNGRRRRVQTENVPRDNQRVGIVRQRDIIRAQGGVQRQCACEINCNFFNALHRVNIPPADEFKHRRKKFVARKNVSSNDVFAQFDVPVGKVNEMFQLSCAFAGCRADLDERTPFRTLGFADEVHPGFLRRAVGLVRVASNAGANDVFPSRRPAAVARDDVVEIQIFAVKRVAAVLAGAFVAFKNVMAREFDFFLRQPVVNQKQDDARHADAKGNGMDRFVMRRAFGKIAPFLKVESAKRAVRAVNDDLRLTLKQKCERPAGGADVDGLPQPVQNQHVLV